MRQLGQWSMRAGHWTTGIAVICLNVCYYDRRIDATHCVGHLGSSRSLMAFFLDRFRCKDLPVDHSVKVVKQAGHWTTCLTFFQPSQLEIFYLSSW